MTVVRQGLSVLGARAGQLACICGFRAAPDEAPVARRGSGLALGAGFAVAALAQALAAGLLPLAAADMASSWVGLPYAALLAGAAVATFPASFLLDGFGRRTGFALGASLGIAGGLLLAVAILQRQFVWLCLGAFWIGIAQGFGYFYRHAAALGRGADERGPAVAGVFAAGALAGIGGPTLASVAENIAAPYLFVGTSLLIALAHVVGLAVAVSQPSMQDRVVEEEVVAPPRGAWLWPAAFGVVAWFGMSALMVATPLAMAGCGVAAGTVFGAVSWHVVAMYAPAGLLVLPAVNDRRSVIGLALVLLGLAIVLQIVGSSAWPLGLALVLAGASWSVMTVATTAWLHEGHPSRGVMALHDAILFAAAILGSIFGGSGVLRWSGI